MKGRGRLRILKELEAAGVDETTARAATDAALEEVDESTLIERALARRLRGPVRDAAHLRRLHQYLVRLGFPAGAAAAALRARRGSRGR